VIALGFLLAAAFGSFLRGYVTDLNAHFTRQMYGTATVNIAGSFLLGILRNSSASAVLIVGVGGLGALTTFSTFVLQIEFINREGRSTDAVLYVVGMLTLGVGAAWLGWSIS
jgi:CrcB protein